MKAYTLIEVIIAIMLLAIILLGGTTLFYQNLKTTGLSDVNSNLSDTLQSALRAIEKDVLYSSVTAVGAGVRSDCQVAGVAGYTGNSLTVNDLNGAETVYSLKENRIASASSETGKVNYLNSADITVEFFQFTWFCLSGISDKIKIAISASSNALSAGIRVTQSASTEVNLLNSGLN